jgi:hypothetical protein
MHKFFSMCLFLFITLYMFRAHRAHHQERQIVIYIEVININKHIENNLCITLVIYQESLHDARSTKCKIILLLILLISSFEI